MQAGQSAAAAVSAPGQTAPATQRYLALDAYRGFIMLILASGGFGFGALMHDPTWGRVAHWFDHVPWEGAVFWDMIQPAFMFMVGVALPLALANRTARGATYGDNFRHVLVRSLRLIVMSEILIWVGSGQIKPQLINVLSQIAFTYFLGFLIMQLRFRWQVVAAVLLVAGHASLYLLFPGPDGPYSRMNSVGLVLDRAIFHYDYDPSYSTLNFMSSTLWTLTGIWTARLLMGSGTHARKLAMMVGVGLVGIGGGLWLSNWIPMVKQLCTASFILYSNGWVFLMLAGFYYLIEMRGYRKWTFPLVVIGANSIFIYSLDMVLREWLDRAVGVFTGHFKFVGTLAPVAQSCAVLAVMWYLCYWLYRRKIFLKL
jgi:heparan-alpha-glucosaminide N-acetyltransferase